MPHPLLTPARPSAALRVRRGGVLKGCLISLAILLVLAIAAGVYVYLNWKSWAAAGMKMGAEAAITDTSLPQDQKTRMITRIGTVADDWQNGKVTNEQFGKAIEAVMEGPILPLAIVAGVERQHINPSALSTEEKADASRALQRVARGVIEKSISRDAVQSLSDMISDRGPGNSRRARQNLNIEELKKFIAAAKAKADEAKVPDEPFTINYADELDKAIDTALGKP